jgi:hypothetical protein
MKKLVMILLLLAVFTMIATVAQAKWSGIDQTIVEKYAKDYGREARDPYINTNQGDLLLFVFLIGGVVGGFIAGYSYRMLVTTPVKTKAEVEKQA